MPFNWNDELFSYLNNTLSMCLCDRILACSTHTLYYIAYVRASVSSGKRELEEVISFPVVQLCDLTQLHAVLLWPWCLASVRCLGPCVLAWSDVCEWFSAAESKRTFSPRCYPPAWLCVLITNQKGEKKCFWELQTRYHATIYRANRLFYLMYESSFSPVTPWSPGAHRWLWCRSELCAVAIAATLSSSALKLRDRSGELK